DPAIAAELEHFPGGYEDASLLCSLDGRRAEEREQQDQRCEPREHDAPTRACRGRSPAGEIGGWRGEVIGVQGFHDASSVQGRLSRRKPPQSQSLLTDE